MWASGHNGDIKRAAYGYEPTREAAMAASLRVGEEAKSRAAGRASCTSEHIAMDRWSVTYRLPGAMTDRIEVEASSPLTAISAARRLRLKLPWPRRPVGGAICWCDRARGNVRAFGSAAKKMLIGWPTRRETGPQKRPTPRRAKICILSNRGGCAMRSGMRNHPVDGNAQFLFI